MKELLEKCEDCGKNSPQPYAGAVFPASAMHNMTVHKKTQRKAAPAAASLLAKTAGKL